MDPDRTYKGSSKGMEGWAVIQVLELLQKDGFEIERFAHDNDASTRKHILEIFPNAIEDLCISHGAKNFRDQVKAAAKQHKSLKGLGNKAFQWFHTAITMTREKFAGRELSDESVNDLTIRIENFAHHIAGNHEKCDHETKSKKEKPEIPTEDFKKLEDICKHFASKSKNYVSALHSNKLESLNSIIAKQVPKMYDFPKSYKANADAALIRASENVAVEQEYLSTHGHRNFDFVRRKLNIKQKVRAQNQQRRNTPMHKTLRKLQKSSKREKNKKTKQEKDAKVGYKEEVKCGCVKSLCKNARCGCKSSKNKCNENCACKGNCEYSKNFDKHNSEVVTIPDSEPPEIQSSQVETSLTSQIETPTQLVTLFQREYPEHLFSNKKYLQAFDANRLWSDTILNDYFAWLCNDNPAIHYVESFWKSATFFSPKSPNRKVLQKFLSEPNQTLIAPVHGHNHWSCLVFHHQGNRIVNAVHFDSFNKAHCKDMLPKAILIFKTAMKAACGSFVTMDISCINSVQQPDAISCGYYSCFFARNVVQNRSVFSTDLKQFSQYVKGIAPDHSNLQVAKKAMLLELKQIQKK
ncbi:MAG: hypothetical protein IM592_05800 [Bacteroidetes bacterium]|nr:hypothetical protein [Bacteroidota bacterium]